MLLSANYIDFPYNSHIYKLTIQDTAGVDERSHIPAPYITNSDGYVLVYSITDDQSFAIVKEIYEQLIKLNNRK